MYRPARKSNSSSATANGELSTLRPQSAPGFDWDTQAAFEAVFKGVGQVMFAGSTARYDWALLPARAIHP
jgi:hypothetical protein